MKRTCSLFILIIASHCAVAQPDIKNLPVEKSLSHAAIEDYYIGWEGGLSDPNKTVTGKMLNGRVYSAKQIDLSRKFIQWMQASYTPKGCIGIAKYFQNRNTDKYRNFGLGTFYYDDIIPQLYGAYTQTWQPIKKRANNTFYPFASEPFGERWNISANQLEYITTAINCISTPDENFFIMPAYIPGQQNATLFPYASKNSSYLNFDKHPNLQPFQHFVIPRDIESITGKGLYVVLITKDNQPLPVEGITLGEFLDRLEKNVPLMCKNRYENNIPSGYLEQAQRNMTLIKENYKNRRNEEARMDATSTIDFIDIKDADKGKLRALEIRDRQVTFPVLRLKKAVTQACKTDSPQWIAIYWSMNLADLPASVHMMESILNNFNFRYVYDYFYANKTTVAYKPLRSPLAASHSLVPTTASSKEMQEAATNKNILFFDDFSNVANEGYPANWKSGNDFRTGYNVRVKTMNEIKWLEFTSHKAYPVTNMLSADFKMSFNLAVTKGIPSSAQPVTIGLTDGDISLKAGISFRGLEIKFSPGNNGNPGNLWLDGSISAGYSASSCEKENGRTYPYLKVPGFSNDKPLNMVNIQIIKQGELLQILSDGKKIYECKKAIPATSKIKGIMFQGGENDDYRKNYYYIGNVKIERL